MASYNELNALIDAYINRNGVQAITGQILNGVLKAMVEQLGRGYTIMGAATPATDPGTPDGPECYFASEAGTYTDFDGLQVVPGELALLCYTPTDGWTKATIYEGFRQVGATIDGNVGTPSVGVSYANGVLSFDFHNMKGEQGIQGPQGIQGETGATGPQGIQGETGATGATGPQGPVGPVGVDSVAVSVDNTSGSPEAEASLVNRELTLSFHGLKGAQGEQGIQGIQGPVGPAGVTSASVTVDNTSGTPTATVSLVNGVLTIAFSGLKGAQGDTGSSVDYPFTIVNNLTTDDPTQALSAAMGVELDGKVSQLEAEVVGFVPDLGTWSVGSVAVPSGGHIADASSNKRMRTAELTIQVAGTYSLKCNEGYRFGLMVVTKRETLSWESELSISLQVGDVYRIILREDPDPTNADIYSGWTQTQIDALIEASGFVMSIKGELEKWKDELDTEILSAEDYSVATFSGSVWPRPIQYVEDGLVFFLDGNDFVAGQQWVDKIGGVAFTMIDCVKDGHGVRFNGTSSRGSGETVLNFPNQEFTIEMVVKLEKAVTQTSESQVVFNPGQYGSFALGYSYNNISNVRTLTNQVGTKTTNISYGFPGVGTHRYSLNKNLAILNLEKLTPDAIRLANWNAADHAIIGSNASGNFPFGGLIYAIRVYNRLLSEYEMKDNQVVDAKYYNL